MTGGRLQARRRLRRATTRRSASPTATASPTSTSRASIAFHRAHGKLGDGDRGAAARPLRRAATSTATRVARLQREAARRRRPDQRRLLRARRRRCSTASTATRRAGSASRSSGLARDGQLMAYRARRLLAADGHAARQEPARGAVGDRARRRGRAGDERDAADRVLARQARPRSPATPASRAAGWRSGCSSSAPRSPGSRCAPPTEPSLFDARRRRRRHRAAASATSATPRRSRGAMRAARPRDRLPPRRAAAGARVAIASRSRPSRPTSMGTVHLLEAVRELARRARRRRRHHRQVLRNREWAVAVSRGRRARRPRSLQRAARPAPSSSTASYRERVPARRRASPVATARAGNVIGGGDWASDRLVPDVVRAWRRGDDAASPPARARSGPGSTCSSRSPATCAWPSGCGDAPDARRGLELRPAHRRGGRASAPSIALARAAYGTGEWRADADERGPHEAGRLALEVAQGARACSAWRRAGACARRSSGRCAGTGASTTAHRRARCAKPTSPHVADARLAAVLAAPLGSTPHEPVRRRRHAARRPEARATRPRSAMSAASWPGSSAPTSSREAGWTAPVAQINHTLHAPARQRPRHALPAPAARREEARPLPARRGVRRRRRPAPRLADLPALARASC